MFITSSHTYYESNGGQHASRAWYLILAERRLDPTDEYGPVETILNPTSGRMVPALYGCVRKVAMSQCGQFMMGTARVGQQSIVVSGTFGNDGLPKHTIAHELVTRHFQRLPDDVALSYWNSGHDYHAGIAGDYSKVKAWALARVQELKALQMPKRELVCHWPQLWRLQQGQAYGGPVTKLEHYATNIRAVTGTRAHA